MYSDKRKQILLNGNYKFSSFALNYAANVKTNGGVVSIPDLILLDTKIFIPLSISGDLQNIDNLHIYAGNTSQIAARTNLINNSFYITPVNSPSWTTETGYGFDGATNYLNLNYNAHTGGANYLLTETSATIAYGAKVGSYPSTKSFGARDNVGNKILAIFRLNNPAVDALVNDGTDLNNPNVVTGSIALFAGQRYAASGVNCKASIVNNNFLYANHSSTGIPNLSLYQGCRNQLNVPLSFDDQNHYYVFSGNKNIDAFRVHTAIINFFTDKNIS